ncbi:hypothetical protein GCM10011344_37340 [Dokdonia pacifica]|uniref:Uncharacterized protein n=1 Tax=Dokdonia pacifica TaxID=1627892 RepID=A0A239B1A9_9FLAO|nr:hypothetical protein [Dokdonia pacifica]GGG32937.1 hypothetical protein GCM10011344_37340 [Dokdonia pacifica]SNS01746.1 hypothetical protein SAMN06265376_105281 [Dokdonia pacifica]
MLLQRTNIQEKLLKERSKVGTGDDILAQVRHIFEEDRLREKGIIDTLKGVHNEESTSFDIDLLDKDRIFHSKQIQKICINYRLRFLDTKYFKGKYPQSAIDEIKYLENKHRISISNFKIIAPSKMFVLEKADDPLLFAPMGNGYFYLIHKWGNDLHPLRKLLMWPYKSFENLIVYIILLSILATALIPDGLFTKEQNFSQYIMVFFFMFKSIAAVVLFYGFALGKNFNTAIWNSKYDKTR